jgi:major membrane immunogen (membrane-anchored lipoprotein)
MSMNARIGSALALAIGVALAGCSTKDQANESLANGKAVPTFRSLDTDVDGSLTPAEAAKFTELAAVFPQADKDRDGLLSSAEYQDAVQDLIRS